MFRKALSWAEHTSGISLPTADRGSVTRIVRRESDFNPIERNPKSTAFGLWQGLRQTRRELGEPELLRKHKLHVLECPACQLSMMLKYVRNRYKTPTRALHFHLKNKYY